MVLPTVGRFLLDSLTHVPQTSDEFNSAALSAQWKWNYQSRMDKWSLDRRLGYLRLDAFKPLKKGALLQAGNTLTQRCTRAEKCDVTIKMDLNGMADGQQAGLCHFAGAFSALGVSQSAGKRILTFNNNG